LLSRLGKCGRCGKSLQVPRHLYSANTIARFQERLRQAFLGDDRGIARAYLNRLIESVSLGDDEIIIEAKGSAAIEMMAASRKQARSAALVLAALRTERDFMLCRLSRTLWAEPEWSAPRKA